MRLQDLAQRLEATLRGDGEAVVDRLAPLDAAGPGSLGFLANPKYAPLLETTEATAVLVDEAVEEAPCALLRVKNPDLAFARAASLLLPPPPSPEPGVHPAASVSPDATLAADVSVGAGAVVEPGARIGEGSVLYPHAYVGHEAEVGRACRIHPGAVLYARVVLGDRVIVHAHATVGSDGFGYAWDGARYVKIPQLGTVEIADDVEIGAGTTIDRARFGKTAVGPGTKLDNLIQIAHNVRLGSHCAFAAQVGISGSTRVGDGVRMGGQVGIAGHLTLGDGSVFSAKAGVVKDVPPGAHFTGYPARPHRQMLDEWRHLKALARLRETVRDLEKRIRDLEQGKADDPGR
jgi:UDP-3-O-[3-hydroxymyristoyl] glucosamine N-acyltransferase